MSTTENNKAIVGRWFTEFWGNPWNPKVIDELAAPDMLLQYSLHEPRRGKRGGHPHRGSRQRYGEPLTQNHPDDGLLGGAQRDADPDLARRLRHEIRHHAVHADRGEHERHAREHREQQHREALPGKRLVDPRRHWPDAIPRKIGIDRVNLLRDCRGDR